jgi:hypothetical protein
MSDNHPLFRGSGGSAPALLNQPGMMRRGFFRREVEMLLRTAGCALVLSAFVFTLAWGYHQRQEAEAWREQACAYRFADVARRATFLGGEDPRDACNRLQSLGLGLRVSGFAVFADFARP